MKTNFSVPKVLAVGLALATLTVLAMFHFMAESSGPDSVKLERIPSGMTEDEFHSRLKEIERRRALLYAQLGEPTAANFAAFHERMKNK